MDTNIQIVGKVPQRCIIHHISSNLNLSESLTKPTDQASWQTLLEVAKVRNHEPILHLAEQMPDNLAIPDIAYHRYCRSLFTLKRDIESLKRKSDNSDDLLSDSTSRQSKRQSNNSDIIYKKECIFCKKTRYRKWSRSKENLTKSVDLRADNTLRQIAIEKQDTDIMAVTSRDIVAAEAHYHRSCYKEYTRKTDRKHHQVPDNDNTIEDTENTTYSQAEHIAYVELFDYIRNNLITSPEIIAFSSLKSKLASSMKLKGFAALTTSSKNHMRRKIEQQFGNALHIFPDEKGKLHVMPSNLEIVDLAKKYQNVKEELHLWKSKQDNNNIIDKSSSLLRSSIKNMAVQNKWPYHPADTAKDTMEIPGRLKRFFSNLLTSSPSKVTTQPKIERLCDSFSQDLIYAVTNGQTKPPKHILLSYGVKALTGNVELIQILNKFGHGISYSQLEENDTALCLQKLNVTSNRNMLIPQSIKPHVFTNLAFDNIDRLEETLTGAGTTHRVNGIAVQPRVYGPHIEDETLPTINKMKQRSIDIDNKPLETYICGVRVGPPVDSALVVETEKQINNTNAAQCKNLLWMLTRLVDPGSQSIPSWTGFNISTRNDININQDVVSYLPTINAPATEMSTVNEIIKQTDLLRQMLQLDNIVVVMDQALYSKATEILWKHNDRYQHIIIRLGTFHTILTVLAILGKRFQDAGLRDMCIESGLVVAGSVSGVLDGKMYNRAIRVHKRVFEGLLRVAWRGFFPWLEANHPDNLEHYRELTNQVNNLHDDLCQEQLDIILNCVAFEQVMVSWNEYLDFLRHDNGKLSSFWMSYVDIVGDILLGLLRASREGNWHLHLSAISKMIPWCFAYDRVNYARYLPAYLTKMYSLKEKHPEVYNIFCNGGFSVQLADQNPFGRIPVDQTIEMTINKDTQTAGGTTKFSKKSGAVSRFYLTAEYRSGFLANLRDITNTSRSSLNHSDLQRPRIEKDETNVSTIVELFNNWINPFEENDLVCISTATTAPADIMEDLLNAYNIGKKAYEQFNFDRLQGNPPRLKFHDPLSKNKLKTFSNLVKKKKAISNGKAVMLKTDRSLFGRIIVIAQSRSLDMRQVFAHPLGPLPWSLANPDGTPRKTAKSVLAKHLNKLAPPSNSFPTNSATIKKR